MKQCVHQVSHAFRSTLGMRRSVLLLLLLTGFVNVAGATAPRPLLPADGTVTGPVTDEKGETLPGVNVLVKGTSRGSTTNE